MFGSRKAAAKGFSHADKPSETYTRRDSIVNSFSRGDRTSAETNNRPAVPPNRGAADGRTFLYILLALYYYYFFKRTRLRSTLSAHPNATKKPQPHNNIMIIIIHIVMVMVVAVAVLLLLYIFCNT